MPLDAVTQDSDLERMLIVRLLLARDGICFKKWKDEDGRRCPLEAMAEVWGVDLMVRDVNLISAQISAVPVVLDAIRQVTKMSYSTIPHFNDELLRTRTEVLRVVDKAIENLQDPTYKVPIPVATAWASAYPLKPLPATEHRRPLREAIVGTLMFVVSFVSMV